MRTLRRSNTTLPKRVARASRRSFKRHGRFVLMVRSVRGSASLEVLPAIPLQEGDPESSSGLKGCVNRSSWRSSSIVRTPAYSPSFCAMERSFDQPRHGDSAQVCVSASGRDVGGNQLCRVRTSGLLDYDAVLPPARARAAATWGKSQRGALCVQPRRHCGSARISGTARRVRGLPSANNEPVQVSLEYTDPELGRDALCARSTAGLCGCRSAAAAAASSSPGCGCASPVDVALRLWWKRRRPTAQPAAWHDVGCPVPPDWVWLQSRAMAAVWPVSRLVAGRIGYFFHPNFALLGEPRLTGVIGPLWLVTKPAWRRSRSFTSCSRGCCRSVRRLVSRAQIAITGPAGRRDL